MSINELAVLPLAYGVSWKALKVANVGPGDWVWCSAGLAALALH